MNSSIIDNSNRGDIVQEAMTCAAHVPAVVDSGTAASNATTSTVSSVPSESNAGPTTLSGTKRKSQPEQDAPEEGLSLLFAASLLQQQNKQSIVTTNRDVLCGRGGGVNKHIGNIVYRRVVEYNKPSYKKVPKRHRMLVSQSIVQAILNAGGRFLQLEEQDNGHKVWKEIDFRRAIQKTSQALRERSEEDQKSSESSTDGNKDDEDDLSYSKEHENAAITAGVASC